MVQKLSPLGYIETLKRLNQVGYYDIYIPDYISWWNPNRHTPGENINTEDLYAEENRLTVEEKLLVAEFIQQICGINPETHQIDHFTWTLTTYDEEGNPTPHEIRVDFRLYYLFAANPHINVLSRPEFSKILTDSEFCALSQTIYEQRLDIAMFTDMMHDIFTTSFFMHRFSPFGTDQFIDPFRQL